jgi:hypothetical protein
MKDPRWYAVYGAMIAAQVQEYRNRTSNCTDDKMMDGFHEEAETIADMAVEATAREEAWKQKRAGG